MDAFKRMRKNSKIEIFLMTAGSFGDAVKTILEKENEQTQIIQIAPVSALFLVVEYAPYPKQIEKGEIDG